MEALLKMPSQKLKTGRTDARLLAVCICDPGGGIHDTVAVAAMRKTKAVAQFM